MSGTKEKAALLASENGCLRAELAQAKRDIKDWQDSSEAYRLDAERAEAQRDHATTKATEWNDYANELLIRAERAEAKCKALLERVVDAETALSFWDRDGNSEYWLRHPARAALSLSPAAPSEDIPHQFSRE